MTSLSGADLTTSTQLSRRLSVLSSALGAAAVALVVATSFLAGIGGPWGVGLTWVAAVAVAATIVSGHPVGLYVGLALLAIAALAGEGALPGRSLAITAAGLLAVHELARPSLDARHPARFGPGVWRRHLIGSILIAAGVAVAAWASVRLDDLALASWLVPTGLALAALPLLLRRLVAGPADSNDSTAPGPMLDSTAIRVALGVAVAALAVGGAIIGASARSEIEGSEPTAPETPGLSPAPTGVEPPVLDDASVVERGVGLLLTVIVMLVAGFLYVALRRPEVSHELDEIDLTDNETDLGFAGSGQADLEDAQIEIDEQELTRLLDGLALDIGAERDPGRAIRFAYANIEQRLGDAAIVRAEAETEQEFLLRALPALGAHGSAMVDLTGLFEQARFGHRAITENMRADALGAVEVLRAATRSTDAHQPGDGS